MILGSIVYRLVIAIVLQLGMPPNDLKLFTAILVAVALDPRKASQPPCAPLIDRKVEKNEKC